MTKPKKIFVTVAVSLAGLAAIAAIGLVLILRSEWFREYAQRKLVSYIEDATGGKAAIRSFSLDWRRGATVTGLIIHGAEPPGGAPLFEASSIVLRMRLFPVWNRPVELDYLGIEQPRANLLVFPDGRTNLPTPKAARKSSGNGLATVVDLAIRDFEIRNGSVQLDERKLSFSARGRDLRAQLMYDPAAPRYRGQVSMNPLILTSGNRPPLNVRIVLPLDLEKDRIGVTRATIETPQSSLTLNGTVQHLASPEVAADLIAQVALGELVRNFGAPLHLERRGPRTLDVQIGISMNDQSVQVRQASLGLGRTQLELSGTLRDRSQQGAAGFHGNLSLDELGQLLQLPEAPRGDVHIAGNAGLTGASQYAVSGNIDAHDLSLRAGASRLTVGLASSFKVDPKAIEVNGLKISALGGEVAADARLEDLAALTVKGNLSGFSLRTLARAAGVSREAYAGTISGTMHARGNLKSPGLSGIDADVRLGMAAGAGGTPISGRIAASFTGAQGAISIADSQLSLPHSRIDLSGVFVGKEGGKQGEKQAEIRVVSRNLNDFLPALALASPSIQSIPVTLTGGVANVAAQVTGSLTAPQISTRLSMTNFEAGTRRFDRLTADLSLSPSGANVRNATVTRNALQAEFSASVGLRRWSATPDQPVAASASIRNADLADVLALAGQSSVPASGALSFGARIAGTVGNPQGAINLTVANGAAYGEPFDRLAVTAALTDRRVDLQSAQLVAGANRIDVSGAFNHPRESFTTGQLQLHAASSSIQLSQLGALQKRLPGLSGTVNLNADLAGDLQHSGGALDFVPSAISADLRASAVRDRRQNYGDFTATARTNSSNLDARVVSDFGGAAIELTSRTQLIHGYPTTADASIRDFQIDKGLALAGENNVPASGILSLKAHATGTLDDPHASVTFDLTKAVVYDEPLDRMAGQIDYTNQLVNVSEFQLASPAGQFDFTGSLAGKLPAGHLDLRVKSSRIDLSRVRYVQNTKPGLRGTLQLAADASADLSRQNGEPRVLFSRLDTTGGVTGIELNRQALGDVNFKSETRRNTLSFNLDSDIGKSAIHGSGEMRLERDYPLDAKLTFSNVTYSGFKGLFGAAADTPPGFEALLEGQVNVAGPAAQPKSLRGGLQISRLELSTTTPGAKIKTLTLENQGPIVAQLSGSTVQVQNARLTGRNTDIALKGTVALDARSPLNFTVNANTDLTLLQELDRDIYSDGSVALDATVRGAFAQPQINGKLELKNASFNLAGLPSGISNANGVISLEGAGANIKSLTAESGGGKVSLTGFAGFTGTGITYDIRGTATHVRSRYQGASVTASASVSLTGTSQRSLLGGNVTVERVGYGAQTDIGSMLTGSGTPPAASAPTGPLAGMRINIRIQTASGMRFETTMAQGLQATADLTLRGTAASPGMVGRINITAGTLVFFGNQYTVNRGAISFYNEFQIQPVLDIALATSVQSVNVVLNVTGPIDNLKLSYTSDPPLKFDDIVALLATGQTPPDATIAAQQPLAPQQSAGQMGESVVMSQAVASPVASRLQRVFGVSQLKIDPYFAGGSSLPQARVSLQQQITPEIVFTYTQDLSQSNSEILRVEWILSRRFSAVAMRDENGLFGIDFFYKKQFR